MLTLIGGGAAHDAESSVEVSAAFKALRKVHYELLADSFYIVSLNDEG